MPHTHSPMYAAIDDRLKASQPVLLDGPMGTELVRRGVRWRKHGLETDAEAVEKLHAEYLAAGADVIRTDTFQLNPRIYLDVFRNKEHMRHIGAPGLEDLAQKLIRKSIAIAKRARAASGKDGRVAVAGVMAPLEHCFRPDLAPREDVARAEHEQLARVFAEAGADFLFLESMNTIAEARSALAAGRAAGLPVWASFVIGPEGEVLSREPLDRAVSEMEKGGASAVLVNCAPPADITRAVARLSKMAHLPFGGLAHVGKFSPPSWKFEFFPQFIETESWPPAQYAEEARSWRKAGALLVGGCCGTGPAHTAALRSALGAGAASGGAD